MHSSRQIRVPISQGSKYSKHRKKGPAGMPGLSLCWMFISKSFKPDIGWTALAPVSFVPDVAAALSAPLTLHPDRAGMWGTHIVATNPDVVAAVPAVVAADPDPIAVRAGRGGDCCPGPPRPVEVPERQFGFSALAEMLSCSSGE